MTKSKSSGIAIVGWAGANASGRCGYGAHGDSHHHQASASTLPRFILWPTEGFFSHLWTIKQNFFFSKDLEHSESVVHNRMLCKAPGGFGGGSLLPWLWAVNGPGTRLSKRAKKF